MLPFDIAPFVCVCVEGKKWREEQQGKKTKQLNFLVSHKKFMKRHNKC